MSVPKVIRDSFEFISDTAKPLGDIAAGIPEQLIKGRQMTKQQQQQSNQQKQQQTQQNQQKINEHKQQDEKELEKTRAALEQMKIMRSIYESPKKQEEPRVYDKLREEERQRALQTAQAQKILARKKLPETGSVQARGMLGKRRQKVKGMEGLVKDTKVG